MRNNIYFRINLTGVYFFDKNTRSISYTCIGVYLKSCFANKRAMYFLCIAMLCTFLLRGDFMNIKLELLKGAIFDAINEKLPYIEIDADKIADTTEIKALSEIKEIINDEEKEDFEVVEEIVCVFEKYNIDIGGRHDF